MIDLHFAPTPNTWKVSIMLEECGLPYRVVPVDLAQGDQFTPDFLRISPNNKVPAIVDHDVPVAIFESGAILLYLAEKTGRFLPRSEPARASVLQWLFWQVGGLGPMSGQFHHFKSLPPPGDEYGKSRFQQELARLYGVLDRQLQGKDWISEDYSIADIACWGWIWFNGEIPEAFSNIRRWFDAIAGRPATMRGRMAGLSQATEETRQRLSGPWYNHDD